VRFPLVGIGIDAVLETFNHKSHCPKERTVPLLATRRVVLGLAGGSAAALLSLPAAAADPAAQLIEKTASEVLQIIKTTSPGPARQAAMQKVLQAYFDLPFMGQTALGANWNKTDQQQQVRFLKAVEGAEARAYSERFGQYGGQTVTVGKVTTRPNGVSIVDSRINQTNGQPIKVEWEVRDVGRGPRITDVKVEGVSMVMTRRSDFNSYIQNNGGTVEPLIKELESRSR
jgi:phospholipid transport system substrate-binding protein